VPGIKKGTLKSSMRVKQAPRAEGKLLLFRVGQANKPGRSRQKGGGVFYRKSRPETRLKKRGYLYLKKTHTKVGGGEKKRSKTPGRQ